MAEVRRKGAEVKHSLHLKVLIQVRVLPHRFLTLTILIIKTMITTDLKKFTEESYSYITKDSLTSIVENTIHKENEIREAFKSKGFRNSITTLIESKTILRYPESMHLQNDIEQYIFNILDLHS